MTTNNDLLNPAFVGTDTIEALKGRAEDPGPGAKLNRLFNPLSRIVRGDIPVTATYLSDNGGYADLARAEIEVQLANINSRISRISGREAPDTVYADIPSQDWRAGALDIAQLARFDSHRAGNVFFLNCAPRLEERGEKKDNEGEGVYIGMLRNGAVVAAVSRHSFALFRDLVEKGDLEIYKVNVQTKGSQFRSRDFFPWFSQLLAHNLGRNGRNWKSGLDVEQRKTILQQCNFIDTGTKLEAEDIPDFRENPAILRVDCHGNLKLSIRQNDVPEELRNVPVKIKIGEREIEAVIRDSMFDTKSGAIGIAPGSTGDWPDSEDGRFLEVALIGASLRERWRISAQDLKEGVPVEILGRQAPPRALRPHIGPAGADAPGARRA